MQPVTVCSRMKGKLDIYILGDYRPGLPDGLAEFNYQTVHLLKDRFNFHFIEFRFFEEQDYFDEESVDGIIIHTFGVFGLSKWSLSGNFRNWVSELPVENILFHINHIYNFHNYLVVKLLKRLKIKYIHTPHDTYVYGHEFKNSRSLIKRLYREIFVYFIDKYVLDRATLVHALTNKGVSYLKQITNAPIMVVSNHIHDMNIDFEPGLIEPKICFIGRNDFLQKGVDRALGGFALFKSRFKGGGVSLVLIGPSNPSAAKLRDNLIRELGLVKGKDVILEGKVPETKRNQILQQSKAYIHLSRFEGFGLSLVQALCAYKPVIVSSQIPISDKILQYNAGFVIDSDEDVANALSAIFSLSQEEYSQMALSARRCYEEEFHPDVIRPKLINLYETAAYGKK